MGGADIGAGGCDGYDLADGDGSEEAGTACVGGTLTEGGNGVRGSGARGVPDGDVTNWRGNGAAAGSGSGGIDAKRSSGAHGGR